MTSSQFDSVVLGGGPGGYVAGIRLGQHGQKALVVEREHLGGVCLNWGCIPSKAIIHAAHLRYEIQHYGAVFDQTPKVNVTELMRHKDALIQKQRTGIAGLLKANNCQSKFGTARLLGPNQLEVIDAQGRKEQIEFRNLILATGAGIIEVPSFPFKETFIGYARDAVAYDPLPQRLVIIGGGVIGCELGMAYAKLGSKVTIIEMLASVLPGTDVDLLRPVIKTMKKLGIDVMTETKADGYTQTGSNVMVNVSNASGKHQIAADRILVAVGFRPNTKDLGLEQLGIKTDARGWVIVDEQCRTNLPHVYAVGDITGPPLLAHRASHMGEVAADVIVGKAAAMDVKAMPLGVFTDPEVAQVGLTEAQAKEQGHRVRTGLFPMAALGRAGAMNQTEGLVKVVIDEGSDVILGVGICSASANDLIAEACLALEMGALAEDVALTVHVHPTLAEGLMEAAKAARGEALHILNKRPTERKPVTEQRV